MVILTVFQQPESPILFEENNVKAVLDSRDLGVGSLIISERLEYSENCCTNI